MTGAVGGAGASSTLVIQPDLTELVRAAAWLEAAAADLGLPASVAFGLSLCLEEAVSNVIRHAGDAGAIHLALAATPQAVRLSIADRGPAFDPLVQATPARPASIEEAAVGGMGIHLMRRFARAMDYERVDGTNRLTLDFDPGRDGG